MAFVGRERTSRLQHASSGWYLSAVAIATNRLRSVQNPRTVLPDSLVCVSSPSRGAGMPMAGAQDSIAAFVAAVQSRVREGMR